MDWDAHILSLNGLLILESVIAPVFGVQFSNFNNPVAKSFKHNVLFVLLAVGCYL